MHRRERLEKTIAGEQVDRVPVALWRHWPGDDQRAADLAYATLAFQKAYEWDFVNVIPAESLFIIDYGLQDEWAGNPDGTRRIARRVIQRSLDWTELRALEPYRGALGRQLECLRLVESGLSSDETPFLQPILSPLGQVRLAAGEALLIRHMRTHPERLHTGLNVFTETTLRFIEALKRTGIAGIYYMAEGACFDTMTAQEYQTFGLPYDRKILDALPHNWWLNMVYLPGIAPMFKFTDQYPVQAIHWQSHEAEPDLVLGKSLVRGAICGGLSPVEHLHYGTPTSIREAARSAIQQVNGRRLILSAGHAIMTTSPLSNIRAVREAVNNAGVS